MKISPSKNYTKPKYAAKLAALLTATTAMSGCVEAGLAGDVAAPEYSGNYEFAVLSDAFSEYDRLRLSYIEDFDTNEACCFNMYDRDSDNTLTFKTPYLIEQYDENNMLWNKTAYIVFCDNSDPTLQFVGGIDGAVKLDGGYLVPLNSGLSFRLLFVDGASEDITEDLCQKLADSFAKEAGAI